MFPGWGRWSSRVIESDGAGRSAYGRAPVSGSPMQVPISDRVNAQPFYPRFRQFNQGSVRQVRPEAADAPTQTLPPHTIHINQAPPVPPRVSPQNKPSPNQRQHTSSENRPLPRSARASYHAPYASPALDTAMPRFTTGQTPRTESVDRDTARDRTDRAPPPPDQRGSTPPGHVAPPADTPGQHAAAASGSEPQQDLGSVLSSSIQLTLPLF